MLKHLSGGQAQRSTRGLPLSCRALEEVLSDCSSPDAEGPAGTAEFFQLSQDLWRKLRTTNIIESCFMEVRRRTRHMSVFVNVESVDRIIYSIFQRFNLNWKNRTLKLFTQPAKITLSIQILEKR